jgi:hypothetical protein
MLHLQVVHPHFLPVTALFTFFLVVSLLAAGVGGWRLLVGPRRFAGLRLLAHTDSTKSGIFLAQGLTGGIRAGSQPAAGAAKRVMAHRLIPLPSGIITSSAELLSTTRRMR